MSLSAAAMMLVTWTIVTYVTSKLFLKVLRTPGDGDEPSGD